mmetsp:Transcript_46807/g.105117  ORF Transcript_46807/g.105117 Transcript_46807/m.105117 type:complete len:622 (+) Transcript_46807:245-2110(+)
MPTVPAPQTTGGGLKLQVRVDHSRSPKAAAAGKMSGAVCCLVGDTRALGSWDPKMAPQLRQQQFQDNVTTWEGLLAAKVEPGQQYKYCILHEGNGIYAWEESGPMHYWPSTDTAVHDFEASSGGPIAVSGAWPPPTAMPATMKSSELGPGTEHWIPWSQHRRSPEVPHSIMHAFNWPFSLVGERLDDICKLGFAAVQISPAQKSTAGGEWWTRYQPQDYLKIDGLGSWDDLRKACEEAHRQGLMIVADVVFNHMMVVASCQEWKNAQKSAHALTSLKQRLAAAVGPTLDAEDFQWPWFEMSGENWDNENRYEGWGNGEWSELRPSEKVIAVQQKHLQLLLDAGVRGFRFDAVKHMRPEHIAKHLQYLRKSEKQIFAYGEVLSVDASMHQEYMQPLSMPSTDFPLTVYMYRVLSEGSKAIDEGVAASCALAARSEGLRIGSGKLSLPGLCGDSIRFARNHDTVMNPGSFYGLSGSCESARTCWAWLLALHDGSVLVYPEDLQSQVSGPLLRRGLQFRSRVSASAFSSEVGLLQTGGDTKPALLVVALRESDATLCGVTLINPQSTGVKVTSSPILKNLGTGQLQDEQGCTVHIHDGGLSDPGGRAMPITIPAMDAVFLVKPT